jgi:hypothetical protein
LREGSKIRVQLVKGGTVNSSPPAFPNRTKGEEKMNREEQIEKIIDRLLEAFQVYDHFSTKPYIKELLALDPPQPVQHKSIDVGAEATDRPVPPSPVSGELISPQKIVEILTKHGDMTKDTVYHTDSSRLLLQAQLELTTKNLSAHYKAEGWSLPEEVEKIKREEFDKGYRYAIQERKQEERYK